MPVASLIGRRSVLWLLACSALALVSTVIGSSPTLSALDLDDGPARVSALSAILALALGGYGARLLSNPAEDFLQAFATCRRLLVDRILGAVVVVSGFAVPWIVAHGSTPTVVGLGIRDFTLGLATSLTVRRFSSTTLYAGAASLWAFPAVLTGAGTVGQWLGAAFWILDPAIDIAASAALLTVALAAIAHRNPLASTAGGTP